jgi:hypothetical protein
MKLGSPLLKKFLEDAAHKFPGKPIVLQPLHEGLESFYRKFGFVTFKEQVKIPLLRPRKISIDSVIVLNDEEELSPDLSSQKLIQKPVSVQAAISTLSSIPWPIPKPLQISATAPIPSQKPAPIASAQMEPAQMAPEQMAPTQMAPAQMAAQMAPNALIHRRGRKRKFEKLEEEDTSIPLEPLSFLFPPTSVVFYSLIGKDCLDFRGISLRQTMIKFK